MWKGINSKYFMLLIMDNLSEKTLLKLIHHNKELQHIKNISLNDYKTYMNIEIELIPKDNLIGGEIFINFINDSSLFHIYFNDNPEEVKENYIIKNKNINKIKVILEKEIKSLRGLFKDCKCLKEVYFTKFNRKDITDLGEIFENCTSLVKLDLSKIHTDNVTKMDWMFYKCEALLELNVDNFKTENVTDMSCMFKHNFLIKEFNLSNFNTCKVTNMKGMFYRCLSLTQLDLSNFDTSNVTDMRWMFYECSGLRDLNIFNFNTSNVKDMRWMFEGCSALNNDDLSQLIFNGDIDMESISTYSPIELKMK